MVNEGDSLDPVPHLARFDGQLVDGKQVSVVRRHPSIVQSKGVFGTKVESVCGRRNDERETSAEQLRKSLPCSVWSSATAF